MSSSSQFSEHSPKTDELEEIKIDTSALVPASWGISLQRGMSLLFGNTQTG